MTKRDTRPLEPGGLLNHLFPVKNKPAQNSPAPKETLFASGPHHASINLNGVTPKQDKAASRITTDEPPQVRAIERRFFSKKWLVLAFAENAIQVLGSTDPIKPAQAAAKDQPMTGERLVVKFLSLQPIALKPDSAKCFREIPDIAFIHQSHLRMQVQQGIQQRSTGAKHPHHKNRT